MIKTLFVIASAALVAACSEPSRLSPVSPTPLGSVAPVATVPPLSQPTPPLSQFQQPFTELIAGTTIQRKVDASSNPECFPGFGCQYFRITPDRDGILNLELTWVHETQPNQGLDLTHESAIGQVWAGAFAPSKAYLTSHVRAGETSQITVWYTFPGLEFSLQALLQPN